MYEHVPLTCFEFALVRGPKIKIAVRVELNMGINLMEVIRRAQQGRMYKFNSLLTPFEFAVPQI